MWKLQKNCSCKPTNIDLNALNALFDGSHLVNDIDFSFKKSYVPWIWVVISVAPQWDWLIHSRDQLKIYQSTNCDQGLPSLTRSSKVYHAANFLEGAHQWQTDIVPVAGVLCSLHTSFGETTDSTPWHPSVKQEMVPTTYVPFAVDCLSSGCSRDFFDCDLQGWSWQCLTLGFCSFQVTSQIPGAGIISGMWVCWNLGRWRCAARLCKEHTSVTDLEPWHSLTARLQSRLWPALTMYRAEASLWRGSVACNLFIVWSRHWTAQGPPVELLQ